MAVTIATLNIKGFTLFCCCSVVVKWGLQWRCLSLLILCLTSFYFEYISYFQFYSFYEVYI